MSEHPRHGKHGQPRNTGSTDMSKKACDAVKSTWNVAWTCCEVLAGVDMRRKAEIKVELTRVACPSAAASGLATSEAAGSNRHVARCGALRLVTRHCLSLSETNFHTQGPERPFRTAVRGPRAAPPAARPGRHTMIWARPLLLHPRFQNLPKSNGKTGS